MGEFALNRRRVRETCVICGRWSVRKRCADCREWRWDFWMQHALSGQEYIVDERGETVKRIDLAKRYLRESSPNRGRA
jgi:hypothetical protein